MPSHAHITALPTELLEIIAYQLLDIAGDRCPRYYEIRRAWRRFCSFRLTCKTIEAATSRVLAEQYCSVSVAVEPRSTAALGDLRPLLQRAIRKISFCVVAYDEWFCLQEMDRLEMSGSERNYMLHEYKQLARERKCTAYLDQVGLMVAGLDKLPSCKAIELIPHDGRHTLGVDLKGIDLEYRYCNPS